VSGNKNAQLTFVLTQGTVNEAAKGEQEMVVVSNYGFFFLGGVDLFNQL